MSMVFMPARKRKIIIFCLLLLISAVLFAYGICFHSTNVLPKQKKEGSAMLVQSELALIKEVSVGGVKRDESGRIIRTYDKTPPKSCPT